MELKQFLAQLGSESACRRKFKLQRESNGVICKKCGCTEHYWLSTVEHFKCKKCGFRTTLRSGTVMESSKLPFQYWFIAMYLMTMTKKSLSATEMQRQIGHKRYEPIWCMMHKIRLVMGKKDDEYKLNGEIEIDEAFFTTVNKIPEDEVIKRGRGSQKKTAVLVMAESEENPLQTKKYKKSRRCRYFKMNVIEDQSSEKINERVAESVQPSSKIITDNYKGYYKLYSVVKNHKAITVPSKSAEKMLPWVHTSTANAKRGLLATYHRVDGVYLQNYLNEFCYKLNRRNFGLKVFECLLVAACTLTWYT